MKITYNDVFNCYEATECDCKFGKAITLDGIPMVPVTEIIELRDKIQKLHDDTEEKAKAQESYKGFNEKADLACFLYRNDFIRPLNELITQYSLKEKEEKGLEEDIIEEAER